MENSSDTVNRRRGSSDTLLPPSRSAGDSIMSESGATADPFRFDEVQKRLSMIEKSMAAPKLKPSKKILGKDTASNPKLQLRRLCRTMRGRGVAKHLEAVVSEALQQRARVHTLSEVPNLANRVRAALKLAPNPADLVYDCSTHLKDGQTYVLFMELFLQMIGDGEVVIAASTKQAAHARARRWRLMFHACGGFDDDHRIEARAFLLFLATFGIPAEFPSDYVMNLIILSYPCDISQTLRKSQVLLPLIPDMIEKMLQYKLYGEAIDVACTFGVEDKFPPKPIMALLKADYKRTSMGLSSYGSVKEMKKAALDLSSRYRTLVEALRDHRLGLAGDFLLVMNGFLESIQTGIKEALMGLKSNDDGADDGKRKRYEMEMETETEQPSVARRLTRRHLIRKRPRTEPIICTLPIIRTNSG